jgi:hypothetical protein
MKLVAMVGSKLVSASMLALILVVSLSAAVVVSGDSQNGTFTFSAEGYTVTGDLTDAAIAHGGSVQMLMSIDQMITTSYGSVHITGNGAWTGKTDFQTFNGVIGNVAGTVQACAVFACQNADFTGNGTWTGTMTWSGTAGSQGSGTFDGTLIFTGAQINGTVPVAVSGNWTASFEL